MKQHTIKPNTGSRKNRKRVGRGGKTGTYSGRGMNGQNARSGGGVRPGFEGGQSTLLQRMPKIKGFRNPNKVEYFALNVGRLDTLFDEGATVNAQALVDKGVLKKACKIKLLGNGELSKKLSVSVDKASASAISKVEKAGGKVDLPKTEAPKAKAS